MDLFKTQWLQEPPRHVAGPYRCRFAPRYGHRVERRVAFDASIAVACNDDVDRLDNGLLDNGVLDNGVYLAEREILRRMADYDIAA